MKKFVILLACLVLGTMAASAQEPVQCSYIYCQIVGQATGLGFGSKVKVSIDYGQEAKVGEDTRLRNADGTVIKFESMVDAMNWMGEKGWEFCQAYVVTQGQSNIYHWLLRLNTSNLNQEQLDYIMSIFKTKKDFKVAKSSPQTE